MTQKFQHFRPDIDLGATLQARALVAFGIIAMIAWQLSAILGAVGLGS